MENGKFENRRNLSDIPRLSIFNYQLSIVLVFQPQIARRLAGLPIGRAKTLGAQRFQHAQGFFDAAADVDVADD